jgi:hypothetical protein
MGETAGRRTTITSSAKDGIWGTWPLGREVKLACRKDTQGGTTHTASSLFAQQNDSDEDRSALDEAKDFLRDLLKKGARLATEVQKQANQVGISYATLRRAKTGLKIVARKRSGFFSKDKESQQWCWMLPAEDAQDPAEDDQKDEHEHLQQSSEKNTRKFNGVPEDAQDSEFEHLQRTNEHLQHDFRNDAREDAEVL